MVPLTQAHDPGSPVLNLPWLHFLVLFWAAEKGSWELSRALLEKEGGSQHSGNP